MGDAGVDRQLRADAERNRRRILDAAREIFADQGLDVSMRQVARHAKVGEPTLRRRFPSKADLVAEVFKDKVVFYADAAEEALADPDPWHGFTTFVGRLACMQLGDRGFTEVLTMTFPSSMRIEKDRRRAYEKISMMIARAQAAGTLREDFVPEDMILLLVSHAGIVAATGDIAEKFSARLVAYLLQAFAAPGAGPLPAPPSMTETYRALLRLHDGDQHAVPS
ncbi:TetR/AcrR family transcriptional regulator [Streptomyces blattellae]|uniref:TetR/AcrR family transcriptional regulator n=1 Tax=Streptomyces blattellae TaxID=2569855 RepID=UPI0012B78F2F|nr:TetR/AcrR family transcriptional regulator [Streptomyces blattellae]